MYYEFIGSGYLAHETLGVRIEQDGTTVESAFALLLKKVTKPPYPAKVS